MRLPEFLRKLSPIGETLAAIDVGCAELAQQAAQANAQTAISTAEEGLALWERDYHLSAGMNVPSSDRRVRIRSAASGPQTMTPAMLASMAVTVGGADYGEVAEQFDSWQAELIAVTRNRLPEENFSALRSEVDRLKPAHLQIVVSTRGEYDGSITRYAGLLGSMMVEFL